MTKKLETIYSSGMAQESLTLWVFCLRASELHLLRLQFQDISLERAFTWQIWQRRVSTIAGHTAKILL